ncbi:MAG: hypothetical protein HGB12_10900 [Bacteroidetes bacterium]|nr:hypothetical protein [Bacteroidota bacterium]
MNIEEILPDSLKLTAIQASDIAIAKPDIIKNFYKLVLLDTYPFSMRAANVIEKIDFKKPELIKPFYHKIIQAFPNFKIEGVRRCLLKIFTRHTDIDEEDLLCELLNFCFDALISPTEGVGAKVYAIDILYQISNKESDIKNELIIAITDQLPKNNPAFRSRGNKILAKLYKEVEKNKNIF